MSGVSGVRSAFGRSSNALSTVEVRGSVSIEMCGIQLTTYLKNSTSHRGQLGLCWFDIEQGRSLSKDFINLSIIKCKYWFN